MTKSPQQIRFHAPVAEPAGIGMAPLVDIVLLLICFYLFVSKSIADYEDPTIELPTIAHVQSIEEQPAEFVINLDPAGNMNLNDQPITSDSLVAALRAERERLKRSGRGPIVVIRADRRQPFAALDSILDLCARGGVGNVSIRAVEQ